jgi:hypothetical protein
MFSYSWCETDGNCSKIQMSRNKFKWWFSFVSGHIYSLLLDSCYWKLWHLVTLFFLLIAYTSYIYNSFFQFCFSILWKMSEHIFGSTRMPAYYYIMEKTLIHFCWILWYCETIITISRYMMKEVCPFYREFTYSFIMIPAKKNNFVRFEVFTAVTMKNGVFWDVTPFGSCKNRRMGGT